MSSFPGSHIVLRQKGLSLEKRKKNLKKLSMLSSSSTSLCRTKEQGLYHIKSGYLGAEGKNKVFLVEIELVVL